MSFSSDIKKQLCKVQPECRLCGAAELAGIFEFACSQKDNCLKLATENENIAQRIQNQIRENFGFDVAADKGDRVYQIKIEDRYQIENIKNRLVLLESYGEETKNEIMPFDCCAGAYIRGCFLGGGSISDPKKSYHMEFDTKYEVSVQHLLSAAARLGYTAKTTYRKGRYIVYVKEYEAIADLLGCMGAGLGVMELYNIQIEKEMRNTVNRQVNCETANVDKVVKASVRQVEAIEKIKTHIGLEKLPDTLREMARVRMEYPDESLKELAARMGIGKSGVNHRLNRILELSKEI